MSASVTYSDLVARMNELLSVNLTDDWPNIPVERAEGVYFYGTDGRRYLDFSSGMATANVGHRHPAVVKAAKDQIDRLIHGPIGVVMYEPILRLAYELREFTPGNLDSFFFSNAGAEAVEGCLKLARFVTGRPGIVCFYGGFHGRTYGAVSVTTSKVKYRKHYEPMVGSVYPVPFPYCYRCPYGHRHVRERGGPETGPRDSSGREGCGSACLEGVRRLFRYVINPQEVAVILVEPIQGEGGYVVPPDGFLQGLRDICDEHGILLAFDEVQTGFGRTGEMFAAQTFGVTPDIMAIAKGIAGGFPLSATVASPELMDKWTSGSHGTTFGGNPVSCAAALAVLQVFREEKLAERARRLGERALARLEERLGGSPIVGEVRGKGLMIGVEFVQPGAEPPAPNPEAVKHILRRCLDAGLILYPCGTDNHCIRFIPPLVITEEELDRGIDILAEAVLAE